MFCGCPNVSTRGIDHHNAQFRGSLDIDVVDSHPCSCNNFEVSRGSEKFGGDSGLGSNKECFIIGYYVDQLFRCEVFPLVDVKGSSKKGETVR